MLDKSLITRMLLMRLKPEAKLAIAVDTSKPGVVVPSHLKGVQHFVIQQDRNDWALEHDRFAARLGFNTDFIWCVFPYAAIEAVGCDHFAARWSGDAGNGASGSPPVGAKPTHAPHLFLIEGGRVDDEDLEEDLPPVG